MYRVFDTKENKFVTDVIELPNGDLMRSVQNVFKKKNQLCADSQFKITHDIDIVDKNNSLIFEGDILKSDKFIGEVCYIQNLCSYALINHTKSEYYPMNETLFNKCEIIGNVFENKDFWKADENNE